MLSVSLGACSSKEASEPRSPYYSDIVTASRTADSDFEREVLSDGEVTRSEYEESVARYVKCANGQGVTINPVKQGDLYTYELGAGASAEKVADECSVGTTQKIEAFYGALVQNPTKGDMMQLIAACLSSSGLAPKGYDKAAFTADSESGSFPFDAEDPRFGECHLDPASH
ncbi:hypothetical protein [Nocardioides sp.]